MSLLAPGDLVEVMNTPPPSRRVGPQGLRLVGNVGVVLSGEYYITDPPWRDVGMHDVRIGANTTDIATALLRKISGPPADVIPTLTQVVA
jgi:hypothetical protein